MYENVIWEGRFQPIHRGHVEYVRTLLQSANHLWIFVVENEVSKDVVADSKSLPVPEFTAEVDLHHGADKNPLPFWLRYRLVKETLDSEFPDSPITVWGGRRLDLDWKFYDRAFPPNRVFLTPERDEFEDAKARAWNKLGEKVIRVDVGHIPPMSATQLRERLDSRDDVSEFLCPSTEGLLRSLGFLD